VTPELERFAARVEEIAGSVVCGTISVSVRRLHLPPLEGGRGITHYDRDACERLPSASVIKLAILLDLLASADEGALDLEERLVLRDADKVPGSGVLFQMGAGLSLSLLDLASLMITVSDNTASNMLIEHLGVEAINARLERHALLRTRLERKFYDFEARDRGLDNWTCAADMADLLAGLERGSGWLSPASRERALAILKRQQFTDRIPKLLPPGTVVAHKTGTIQHVCHDAGILYGPRNPVVAAILTHMLPSEAEAERVIQQIGEAAYSLG